MQKCKTTGEMDETMHTPCFSPFLCAPACIRSKHSPPTI